MVLSATTNVVSYEHAYPQGGHATTGLDAHKCCNHRMYKLGMKGDLGMARGKRYRPEQVVNLLS